MNQIKNKLLPSQLHFEMLTDDNQVKPVDFIVKHITVPLSQKDDCHALLADFENYQFYIRIGDKGENTFFIPLDLFSFEFCLNYLLQCFFILKGEE